MKSNSRLWKCCALVLLVAILAGEIFPSSLYVYASDDEEEPSVEELTSEQVCLTSQLDGEGEDEELTGASGDEFFTVTGVEEEIEESVDYKYGTINSISVLTILSSKKIKIEGHGICTSMNRINLGISSSSNEINVVLSNVNIDMVQAQHTPVQIVDNYMGNVNLTIEGENTLSSAGNHAALQKNGDATTGTLTISGNGKLTAKAMDYEYGAYAYGGGIGGTTNQMGSNIVINGGEIYARGSRYGAGIGGGYNSIGQNITINGGNVTVSTPGYWDTSKLYGSAGIGGGYKAVGQNITINGGTVNVSAGERGAGIGGGYYAKGTDITINGGNVYAQSSFGAGIGGGQNGDGRNIAIHGGTIEAYGSGYGAGIGGGYHASGSKIEIKNCQVKAVAKYSNAAGIGGGEKGHGVDILIENAEVIAKGGTNAPGIGDGYSNGSWYNSPADVEYGVNIIQSTVTSYGGTSATGMGGGKDKTYSYSISISESSVKNVSKADNSEIGSSIANKLFLVMNQIGEGAVSVNCICIPNNGGNSFSYRKTNEEEEYTEISLPARHDADSYYYLYLPDGIYDFKTNGVSYQNISVARGCEKVLNKAINCSNELDLTSLKGNQIELYKDYYFLDDMQYMLQDKQNGYILYQSTQAAVSGNIVIQEGMNICLKDVNLDASKSIRSIQNKAFNLNENAAAIQSNADTDVTFSYDSDSQNTFIGADNNTAIQNSGDGYLIFDGTGKITATGGEYGAGIGNQHIKVKEGTLCATGTNGGAGIGGKKWEEAKDIIITGGTVTSIGQGDYISAPGIGSGYGNADVSDILITNATVKAFCILDGVEQRNTIGSIKNYNTYSPYRNLGESGVSENLIQIVHNGNKTVQYKESETEQDYQSITVPNFHEKDDFLYIYLPYGTYDLKIGTKDYLNIVIGNEMQTVYNDKTGYSKNLKLDCLDGTLIDLYHDYYVIGANRYIAKNSDDEYVLSQMTNSLINMGICIHEGMAVKLNGIHLESDLENQGCILIDTTEDVVLQSAVNSVNEIITKNDEKSAIARTSDSDGILYLDGNGKTYVTAGKMGAAIEGGNVTVSGGVLYANAKAGDGIGINANEGCFGNIQVTGGFIFASSQGGSSINCIDDDLYIRGGSVSAADLRSVYNVMENNDEGISCCEVTCHVVQTQMANKNINLETISGAEYYKTDHLQTDDEGKVYLWLPKTLSSLSKNTISVNKTVYIRFYSNCDTTVSMQTLPIGSLVSQPDKPCRGGYQFAGWYTSDVIHNDETSWDFGIDSVNENLDLFAYWIKEDDQEDDKEYGTIAITSIPNQIYTGKAIKPEITVYDGNVLLCEGTDYSVSYKNNVNCANRTDKKAPMAIIKGKGVYSGTLTKTFCINPLNISTASDTIEVIMEDAYYASAKDFAPACIVTRNGKKLKKGKEYTVSFMKQGTTKALSKIKEAGTYSVIIEGTGNYSGTQNDTIVLVNQDSASLFKNQKFTLKNGKVEATGNEIQVKTVSSEEAYKEELKKDKSAFLLLVTNQKSKEGLVEGRDYTISYQNNIQTGTATMTISGNKGNGYVGSKKMTFSIIGKALSKQKGITVATKRGAFPKSVSYNGKNQTITDLLVSCVSANGETQALTENVDYSVAWKNQKNVGTAVCTIYGKGQYTGSIVKKFKITATSLLDEEQNGNISVLLGQNGSVPYAKGGSKCSVSILYKGSLLTENIDYTVQYANNDAVNETVSEADTNDYIPYVKLTGKGNFMGSIQKTFRIMPKSLSSDTVHVEINNCAYLAKQKDTYLYEPEISVFDGETELKEGSDYSVLYQDNQQADVKEKTQNGQTSCEIKAIIMPINPNYKTDIRIETISIVPTDIKSAKIKIRDKDVITYTGNAVNLSYDNLIVTVKVDGKEIILTGGTDYEIVNVEKNWIPGTAQAVIRGIGDTYGGMKKIKFVICKKKLA